MTNDVRSITTNTGGNTTTGGTPSSNFSYAGYAARLLTIQEVRKATDNVDIPTWKTGELDNFTYLFENTMFSNDKFVQGYWLESPRVDYSNRVWSIYGLNRFINYYIVSNSGALGIRPVIEVSKTNIDY